MLVEICANSLESALAAQQGGADRIELCTALHLGGLTPSHGLILKTLESIQIPAHVLIRPRPGNFHYSKRELAIMEHDIAFCREVGCAGIVTGVLDPESVVEIDIPALASLIMESLGMDFTFHRAFDLVKNPERVLDILIKARVTRILTSGQQPKAIDGINLLKKLKKKADNQLEIMPGGGINPDNVSAFIDAGFESVHLSATGKAIENEGDGKEILALGNKEPITHVGMVRAVVNLAKAKNSQPPL